MYLIQGNQGVFIRDEEDLSPEQGPVEGSVGAR